MREKRLKQCSNAVKELRQRGDVPKNSVTRFGFSLIELLVVIAIMATIIGLALPNFLGTRSRARDVRRKGEMSQLKTALQLYYADYNVYPAAGSAGIGKLNYIAGCGADGDILCPASCSVDFAAGGAGCNTVYMTNFPGELGSSMYYFSNNTDYCITDTLENQSDGDIADSYAKCNAKCTLVRGSALSSTDYAVCSE